MQSDSSYKSLCGIFTIQTLTDLINPTQNNQMKKKNNIGVLTAESILHLLKHEKKKVQNKEDLLLFALDFVVMCC